jgi:hypothetical protein
MAKARKENKCESEGGNMKPIIDDFFREDPSVSLCDISTLHPNDTDNIHDK